jgi:hypothetical protein
MVEQHTRSTSNQKSNFRLNEFTAEAIKNLAATIQQRAVGQTSRSIARCFDFAA